MDESIKVIHLNDQLSFGGGENQTCLLIEELESLNVENHLIHRRGAEIEKKLKHILPKKRLHSLPPLLPFLTLSVFTSNLARRIGVKIVHAHTGRSSLGLSTLPPNIVRVIHRRIPEFLSQRALKRAKTSHAVIAISEFVRSRLLEQGIESFRVIKIHDSVQDVCVPSEIPVLPGKPCFAYLGHFRKHKGLDILFEALSMMDGEFPDLKVLLIGEGPEENNLRSLHARYKLQERVIFLPFQKNPRSWLASIDLLLLPSRHEGLGSVSLEAQSLGKPVLGSAVGGIPEAVKHGITGWLVPPEDPHALAKALRLFASDKSLKEKFKVAAINNMKENFSAREMAKATLNLYKNHMD